MDYEQLLKELDLQESVKKIRKNWFRYIYDLGVVDFIFPKDEHEFFRMHRKVWCENKTEFFLAIFEDGKIHVCDSKTKPDSTSPLKKATIDSFNHRENTPKAQKYSELFKKEALESGECIKEVQKFLKKRKMRTTVFEDLIKNLKLCKKKITASLSDKKDKEEIAEKIIEKCLFIRFLEDKAKRNDLKNILGRKKLDELLGLFDFYSEVFPSICEKGDIPPISNEVIGEVENIFGDTLNCQKVLYSFEDIPVSVIITICEEILLKKGKKRVFTPENVSDYTIDKIVKDTSMSDKISKGKIKILDPACGSGIFLVKFLEKIIEKRKESGVTLSMKEKFRIIKNCLYGIDKNRDALRIARLSLCLKIFEEESPETINKVFGDCNHFFSEVMNNVVQGDPLCDNLCREKFDVVVGNFLEDFSCSGKKAWPSSDQHFHTLLHMKEWMEKGAVSGIVVPLSYFTKSRFKKVRKEFMEKYFLKSFTNLSRMDTFQGEPACIIFFTDVPTTTIEFCTPDQNYFSDITGTIGEDNAYEVPTLNLKEHDDLWHIYALGYHNYVRLLEFLDNTACSYLEDFLKGYTHRMCKEEVTMYKASSKVDSVTDLAIPHPEKEKQEYKYEHVERKKDIDFLKEKLIVTKTWPIKAFIYSDIRYDTNLWIYKLKSIYPEEYLLLFEAILNSKLITFYLEVKHRLKEEGYPGIHFEHINKFPVPDLEFNCNIVNEIIETVKSLKSLDPCGSPYKKLQDDLDRLIFILYDLDYYDRKEIEQYNLEKDKRRNTLVKKRDIQKYCDEFIDTFDPFIEGEFFLNPEWATSESFGTMVRFSASKEENPLHYNRELERFVHIIENQKIEFEKKDIFKEKKIKFYKNDVLYIYKSNKLKDWTEFMAIKDANEELRMHFRELEG